MSYADPGSTERMKTRARLEGLRAEFRELDPVDVLLLARDEIAARADDPRERAIIARYLEDAAARWYAGQSGRLSAKG